MKCRHCSNNVTLQMIDLGFAPPSNSYLGPEDLNSPEMSLPLRVKVCEECWLVQTEDFARRDLLFSPSYAYFSSTSTSWVKHARDYFEMVVAELLIGADSFVVELASNDGYLLKNFVEGGIPCLGVEPAEEAALQAKAAGIPTVVEFFGAELARKLDSTHSKADLIIGNNVYAHVPDINDFTLGIKHLLAPSGTVTLEFPHLLKLMSECQFDTIYHEHYSYLSLKAAARIFASAGLKIFRVEKLSTHGGSLRIFGCHTEDSRAVEQSVHSTISEEDAFQLEHRETYEDFEARAVGIRNRFVSFLIENQQLGKVVVAYGAAAKANTLLNYAGIKPDLLPLVVDAAPSKQDKFLPGTHIPVKTPEVLKTIRPDRVIILPWNLAGEITELLKTILANETELWVVTPELAQLNSRPL